MILADTHVHIYPDYDLNDLINGALKNFKRNTKKLEFNSYQNLVCLTESKQFNFFDRLINKDIILTLFDTEVINSDLIKFVDKKNISNCLYIAAGRQIITGEKIEVLSLLRRNCIEDGLSLRSTLVKIQKLQSLPVLPWSFGKWWGKRGKIISKILDDKTFKNVYLGDISLRASNAKLAFKDERKILCGTDPLPINKDYLNIGKFGSMLYHTNDNNDKENSNYDLDTKFDLLRESLINQDNSLVVENFGEKDSSLKAANRWLKLKTFKK